jgi:hypothetical protein
VVLTVGPYTPIHWGGHSITVSLRSSWQVVQQLLTLLMESPDTTTRQCFGLGACIRFCQRASALFFTGKTGARVTGVKLPASRLFGNWRSSFFGNFSSSASVRCLGTTNA